MKRNNQRGFTHNVALLVLGVFVFAAVGFAGFRVYTEKHMTKAAAATVSWVLFTVPNNPNQKVTVFFCKFNLWGNWRVRSQTHNTTPSHYGNYGSYYKTNTVGNVIMKPAPAYSWSDYGYSEGSTKSSTITVGGKVVPQC